ncbi:WD40 repeat domain-containing protein [Bradyrhizobium sp. INPA03-11B]|uniref:WD40 repeat domain-containing protein n=1 Tax=Bradyrhizobium sp. INPA03-11B TaxID=418598 RepID=UPI00338E01F2
MDMIEAETATLYELLGRHWTVGAPVIDAVFDPAGDGIAFALADGGLAIAPLKDPEPPQDRCRVALDEGRMTISPRRKPVPPLMKVTIGDAPLQLASLGTSGFVAGEGDRLLEVSASGVTRVAANHGAAIDLLAAVPDGGVLAASDGTVIFYRADGDVGWLQQRAGGRASAMAVSPDGRRFAMGTDGGLLVRAFGARPDPVASYVLGSVSALSWSPDGSWLAASIAETGIALVRLADSRTVRIANYPADVTSLSWSADSRILLTGGAYRIVAWDVSSLDAGSERPTSVVTGHAGFVLVETVAMHPERPLVAAGYDDGRLVVAKIGQGDELIVKSPGRGAVQVLRWSRDGQHLAVGTRDGEAAVVTFPPHIFK